MTSLSRDRWILWRPSRGPCPLPEDRKGKIVLFDEDVFDPALPVRPDPLLVIGPTYIVPTHHPATMRRVMQGVAPLGCIPALLVETQADIDDVERVREVAQIRTPHRALVVSSLEPIDLGLFANAPSAWRIGYHPYLELFDLVVVRVVGPLGLMNTNVIRDLHDQASDAGVAFVFVNSSGTTGLRRDGWAGTAAPLENP